MIIIFLCRFNHNFQPSVTFLQIFYYNIMNRNILAKYFILNKVFTILSPLYEYSNILCLDIVRNITTNNTISCIENIFNCIHFQKINLHSVGRKINNLLISYDQYLVIEIQSIPINNNQNNIKAVPISLVIVIQVPPQLCSDLFDMSMLRKKLFLQFKYK